MAEKESVIIPAMERIFRPRLRGCALWLKICDLFCERRAVCSFAIIGVCSMAINIIKESCKKEHKGKIKST